MNKKFVILLILLVTNYNVFSQCVACKNVVESEIQNGNMSANGINNGIIYLMIFPYLLLMGIGFILYKNFKKMRKEHYIIEK